MDYTDFEIGDPCNGKNGASCRSKNQRHSLGGMRCRKGVSNRSNTDPSGETRNHEVRVTKLMRCL